MKNFGHPKTLGLFVKKLFMPLLTPNTFPLLIAFDCLAVYASIILSMALRLESFDFLYVTDIYIAIPLALLCTLTPFILTGLYRASLKHIGIEVAVVVAYGSFFCAAGLLAAKYSLGLSIPRTVPLISAALLFISISGSRFLARSALIWRGRKDKRQIAIYGAGASGIQILRSLQYNSRYDVRMVIDDNPKTWGVIAFGIKVVGLEKALQLIETNGVDTVILAKRQVTGTTKKELIKKLSMLSVKLKSIPPIDKFLDGSFTISDLPDVPIEELLGREPIAPLTNLIGKNINGKTIFVTGAGGSIGSELCRQCLTLKPTKLIICDISESAIYQCHQELITYFDNNTVDIVCVIGSVADRHFINRTLAQHSPDTVFHAAAYKHVPLMEDNIVQAVKNNSLGTFVLAEEAIKAKVQNFTLISTDKAVNPTNIMGATKRLAEMICESFNNSNGVTHFSIVRFGNVLGSSGSVVPRFKQQIKSGGPITLTHPEITRYFMTVNEAVTLVIQASSISKTGGVFVLDMGEPVKILDLAFNMVLLSGLTPQMETDEQESSGDVAIRITGLRPGEKLFEELTYGGNLTNTEHPRIMFVCEKKIPRKKLRDEIEKIESLIKGNNEPGIVRRLKMIANYAPQKTQPDQVNR